MKKLLFRSISLALTTLSVLFGVTLNNNYCIGDQILSHLGVSAWSNDTQGFHYTAICSLIMLLIALPMYAATTKNKRRTYLSLAKGFCILYLVSIILDIIF